MTSIASRAAAASPTRPWPAERVEQWPIERLIPYADNPRLHSAADIDRIAASILKWGWTNPVLVDDNELAARGSWDPDLLHSELRDLKFSGFDLDLIGCLARVVGGNFRDVARP